MPVSIDLCRLSVSRDTRVTDMLEGGVKINSFLSHVKPLTSW